MVNCCEEEIDALIGVERVGLRGVNLGDDDSGGFVVAVDEDGDDDDGFDLFGVVGSWD